MAGKRSWIDEAADAIMAKSREAARTAKRIADITLQQMGDEAVAEGERWQEASRQLLGDPTYSGSRNPFQIFADVSRDPRSQGHDGRQDHNGVGDAWRHAEASRRLSGALGTPLAWGAGTFRELAPRVFGARRDEMIMDLHSNREGRRAFEERRPIDPRNLQTLADPSTRRRGYTSY